jgi:hypothetical protein
MAGKTFLYRLWQMQTLYQAIEDDISGNVPCKSEFGFVLDSRSYRLLYHIHHPLVTVAGLIVLSPEWRSKLQHLIRSRVPTHATKGYLTFWSSDCTVPVPAQLRSRDITRLACFRVAA